MKANKKVILREDDNGYAKMVGGLVALLIAIIIGVMIFWSLSGSMPGSSEQTEYFTGYTLPAGSDSSGGSNDTATVITLKYVPYSTDNSSIAVVCYNATAETEASPPVTIANRVVTVQSGSGTANPPGYSQINVTYTTKFSTEASTTNTMASTVFALLPIIALVVVASIILGIVLMFGSGSKGGNL